MKADQTRPRADEFELSLFGAGSGECVVLHLGGDEWVVVDSFRDSVTRRPVATQYLERIGVSLNQVRLVVASHFHDDHIAGIAEVLWNCDSAKFVMSGAIERVEFPRVLALDASSDAGPFSTGLKEFRDIIEQLKNKTRAAEPRFVSHVIAHANTVVWNRSESPDLRSAQVIALSPSATMVTHGWRNIGKILEGQRGWAPSLGNDAAVVLSVRFGDFVALLGADLEETRRPGEGWTGLVEGCQFLDQKASVFKVSHHGSPNGDHDLIWSRLLTPRPISVVAPYSAGRTPRPSDADIKRLCGLSSSVWRAGRGRVAPPSYNPTVEKVLRDATSNRRGVQSPTGQVRVRIRGAEVSVATFDEAQRLCGGVEATSQPGGDSTAPAESKHQQPTS